MYDKIVILQIMKNSKEILFDKLNEFISKFYKNQLIRGGIYSTTILLGFFLIFSILEYYSQFNTIIRTVLFWSYVIINAYILYRFVITPLMNLNRYGKVMSMEKAAIIIGKHFNDIDDKLLNVLELNQMNKEDDDLINASINQKIDKISTYSFLSIINFYDNKKYGKWLAIPIIIMFFFFTSGNKHVLTESSARIIKHNTFFEPKAPFSFIVDEDYLSVIKQEDFQLSLSLEGSEIPDEAFIMIKGNKFRLTKQAKNTHHYVFKNVLYDTDFQLLANGFNSKIFTLKVFPKPSIINFEVFITPPKYTGLKKEQLTNIGDLNIVEGTGVNWNFDVENTDRLFMKINGETQAAKQLAKNKMAYQYRFLKSEFYRIITENNFEISDSIGYHINIIRDAYPTIAVEQEIDSLSEKIFFNGIAKDDYKIRKIEFCYQLERLDSTINEVVTLNIKQDSEEQFFHHFDLALLDLTLGSKLLYYFKVWDNDGINGSKFSKSQFFNYNIPDGDKLDAQIEKEDGKIKTGLKESIQLSKEIKKDIAALNKDLLEKKKLGWEEKKKLKELMKKKKALEQQMQQLKDQNNVKQQKQERYREVSPELLEKQKQLEKLFEEVLDEESKKLLEEMQKMLEEMNKENLKKLLDKLQQGELDLEKELDRNLELFKQLEFDQKLENALEKLSDLKEKQTALQEKTKDKKAEHKELEKEQEKLNDTFEEWKKDIEDLKQKNQKLEDKNNIPETKPEEQKISEQMQESKENLRKNKKKNSSKSQQKVLEKMKELEQKLEGLQSGSCSNTQEEDLKTLRQILENLIRLSLDQEELMSKVKVTPKNSPNYVELVKSQKKLVEDAKIIEDSIFALSKRVVQIQHAVNKEIAAIKNNMASSTNYLEERIVNKAAADQQFSMTSANNLALILSEMLNQMQKDIANQQKGDKPCNKQCNKPGSGKPSLSQLKKMQKKLNQEMKGMAGRKGKKKGNKLNNGECKSLSKLSEKQELIRKQLEELRNEMNGSEKGNVNKMIKQMEENEIDIVNNRITKETLKRQEEILSRLLDAEKAEREKEKEPKREAIEWKYEITDENNSYSITKNKKKNNWNY